MECNYDVFLQLKKYDKIYKSLYFLYKFCPFIEAPLNNRNCFSYLGNFEKQINRYKGRGGGARMCHFL